MNRSAPYVGQIGKARLPFYNSKTDRIEYKARPALIIGAEKEYLPCDFTLLPLSRVTHKRLIDEVFDVKLTREKCLQYNLNSDESYIRTHKVFTTNSREIGASFIYDLKTNDPDMYAEIRKRFEAFTSQLFE